MLMRTVLVLFAITAAITAGQDRQDRKDRTAIFVCGVDEKLPEPIPVRASLVILAGDGRLFQPCPQGNHGADHRENREQALIRSAFNEQPLVRTAFNTVVSDPELRLRAAQAQARLSNPVLNNYVPIRIEGTNKVVLVGGVTDSLGSLVGMDTVVPACNAKIQVFQGRDTLRWQPGPLFRLLLDSSMAIQTEAAYGIGRRLADPGLSPTVKSAAVEELKHCLTRAKDHGLAGRELEAFGTFRYETDEQRAEIEALLVKESHTLGDATVLFRIIGAVKGLEGLIRLDPQRTVREDTRIRLRQLAIYGIRITEDPSAAVRRLAMLALQAARDTDSETLRVAATDGDWQVRRIVAAQLNLSNPEQKRLLVPLEVDTMFQVRYELLLPLARLATATGECAPIVQRFKDPSPIVIMRAMDLLVAACTDLDDATKILAEFADKLAKPEEDAKWHLPSRALSALARVKPDLAKPRLEAAVKHAVWQVRAAAAATSATLANEDAAVALAKDLEPNVRNAALEALSRMKSTQVVPQAIDALNTGEDYQLLRTAALVLKGLPAEEKPAASTAMLGALTRLTEQESDTSRDTRVAILERLGEALDPGRSNDLIPYTIDYDDEVVRAASKAFEALVGGPPAEYSKKRRYPYQPSEEELDNLPKKAQIHLEEGTVELTLLTGVAPVTVARFAALARQGFYENRTFHRIAPNFVVQGGSPGANEYAGTARFIRDEPGPQGIHVRGAVGISTRGADTGDGQIFIDLVDLPRLDRDYTVFAYVSTGMEFVDRLLEGAKIVNISIK